MDRVLPLLELFYHIWVECHPLYHIIRLLTILLIVKLFYELK